jgi:hypothetical protein
MGEPLLGAPRTGRGKAAKDPDPGKAFPGGEIYLSMPGLVGSGLTGASAAGMPGTARHPRRPPAPAAGSRRCRAYW